MATLKLKLSVEQILELIRQLPKRDKSKIVEELLPGIESELQKEGVVTSLEQLFGDEKGTIPEIENIDAFVKKYALKEEQLNALEKLFEDAPSAEELCKMLKP